MNRKYKVLEKNIVYDGFFQMEKYRLQYTLFNGGWSNPIHRELFERGHAVAVLLYDPDKDAVVMIEQFRIGAIQNKNNPWLLETVAGIIEDSEKEEDVAKRESLEEAGCQISKLEFIARYWLSPGGTSETMTLFCGKVDSTNAGGVHGLDYEDEDILVHILPFEELMILYNDGKISSATPLLAVQWLIMHRKRLRDKWRAQ